MSEPIKLEDLAAMIARGFDDMGDQMSGIGKRIDALEARVDNGFNRMDQELTSLRSTIVELRRELEPLNRRGDVHEEELGQLDERLKGVEKRLGLAN